MRDYIYSLMTDARNDPVAKVFKSALYVVSLAYGLAIFLRRLFYRFGIFKTARLPMRIISVGNLTLGGTGKTPFVIALAGIVESELHRRTSVLIRGYGWDEQAMLKKNLVDVPILVGEDRARSGRRAIRLYGSDTAILDDGFQHWELARDIDIVLVDSRNPFGNGYLFPRGILREPKARAARAEVIVFTKVDKAKSDTERLRAEFKKMRSDAIFLEAVHRSVSLYDSRGNKAFDLAYAAGKNTVLLSSVGDPGYFSQTVNDLGAKILKEIIFPDHHDYTKKDMERIVRQCGALPFDFIITTEKDAVKLQRLGFTMKGLSVLTLAVSMDITKGKEELIARLRRLYTY